MLDDGVNDIIEKVSVWMEAIKLAINKDKCRATSFGGTNETPEKKFMITSNFSITLNIWVYT